MNNKMLAVLIVLLVISLEALSQTGPFVATIERVQVKDIGNPYNTVFLNRDIVDSPCSSTNTLNRFAVLNNAQQATVLAAVMANKEVIVYGTGVCNSAQIEDISAIIIKP